MKDIRPRVEEHARRRREETRPPGSGFMSERTRAKEALRIEVSTYTGENVRKIASTDQAAEDDRILRVAAYCRTPAGLSAHDEGRHGGKDRNLTRQMDTNTFF